MNRKPRILIHIEDPRRDGSALIALAALFEQAGAQAFLSTRRTTALLLKSLRFEAALIPSADSIAYDAYPSLRRRTRFYMLPTEGAIFEEGPLMIKYGGGEDSAQWDRHIESIRRFFLWGENSRQVLLRTGRFREDQLQVAGAPRMDFFLTPSSAPQDETGGWIGFVSSFILINSVVHVPLMQNIDLTRKINWASQSKTRYFEDRLWTEAACFRTLLTLFEECQRRRRKLWVRMHIQEDRRTWLQFRERFGETLRFGAEERPFESWLDNVRAVVGFNSTTFFEAVAAGKPALNLAKLVGPRLAEHTDGSAQTHYPIMDQVESSESWDDVFLFLERVRGMEPGQPFEHSAQARAIVQDVCHFPRPVSALAQVVQTVLADLGESPKKNPADRLQERRAVGLAKALEHYTFSLRRDPIGNCWFPLPAARLKRRFQNEIQRYLQAAQAFPWIPETESRPRLEAESISR